MFAPACGFQIRVCELRRCLYLKAEHGEGQVCENGPSLFVNITGRNAVAAFLFGRPVIKSHLVEFFEAGGFRSQSQLLRRFTEVFRRCVETNFGYKSLNESVGVRKVFFVRFSQSPMSRRKPSRSPAEAISWDPAQMAFATFR